MLNIANVFKGLLLVVIFLKHVLCKHKFPATSDRGRLAYNLKPSKDGTAVVLGS